MPWSSVLLLEFKAAGEKNNDLITVSAGILLGLQFPNEFLILPKHSK